MIGRSIRTKLLLAVGFFYVLSTVCVLSFTLVTTKRIITSEKEEAYAKQLDVTLKRLQKSHEKLVASGMEQLYSQGYKESAARELGELHYSEGQTIYPFIVDRSGTVVLHPMFEPGSDELGSLDFIQRMLARKNGTLEYMGGEDDQWMVFKTFEPWGWTIGYTIKLEDKYASVNAVVQRIAGIMIGSSLIVLCIMYFMLSRIVGPLRVLAEDAKIIGQGDLKRVISRVPGQDEIAELADAFRTMASNVGDREKEIRLFNDKLEQRVEERTIELKEANDSLLRIKHAVESSTDAVSMSTPEGDHVYQNEAFSRMFGYETVEDLTSAGGGYVTYRDRSVAEEVFSAVRSGKSWTGEVPMKKVDGSELTVLLRTDAIKEESGRIIGLVCLHTDITDRKQAEEEISKAKEAAEAATEAKSMFLANMSHEIRTPLNGVIGMTGLLMDTELNPEQRQFVEVVRVSGESLLSVINDILDFSKIEAKKLDLEILDFNLRNTLEDVRDILRVSAQAKKLELRCHVDSDVPSLVKSDPGRLRQILTNLANNAIKFSKSGEVAIKARLEKKEGDRVTIRFSVTDTGIGIPQDRIDRLFQSFSQVDASNSRVYGGTGLGLVISQKLCEMMGGEMGVDSIEGKGSTFWFTVVLESQAQEMAADTDIPEDVRAKRVLVVDHNATNRRVVENQLLSWGCRHGQAESGPKALEMLKQAVEREDPYAIAIVDMQMPVMGGETLGRKIKEDPEIRDTALVMIAPVGFQGDAVRLKKTGFDACLTKPIERSCLYNCLVTVSGKKTVARDERANPLVTRHSIREDRKRKVKILLAEDNIINQKVAQKILERYGYRADTVANGQEAVKALELIRYDVVLMDVQMPEMDGYQATAAIRNEQSGVKDHNVPIIAMTASAMKGDRKRCLDAGMDDYTTKPVNPKVLIEKIEQWAFRAIETLDLEVDSEVLDQPDWEAPVPS